MEGPPAGLDSIVEHLADAAGIFGASGEPLFANPTLRTLLASFDAHGKRPFDRLIQRTRETRMSAEPETMTLPWSEADGLATREWLVVAHPVEDRERRLLGVMIVARDLQALGAVESTIRYSRKLAALGRLTAGVAHEVKNPLNAMTIHLELMKGKLAKLSRDGNSATAAALEHVNVIGTEIRRLDQVVQGFLKFTRPEDLHLGPVPVDKLLAEIAQVVQPDARWQSRARAGLLSARRPGRAGRFGVAAPGAAESGAQRVPVDDQRRHACDCPRAACRGGEWKSRSRTPGSGIAPEHLQKIFDLYFTTKPEGSGIGLSMVYRTVQLHDGEIEVQSTPGTGTRFRILLPQT